MTTMNAPFRWQARLFIAVFGLLLHTCPTLAAELSGELRKWHKVTLTFDGPNASESDTPNPFVYYRLNVTFTHQPTGKSYLVPGYFAADGDAANTGATGGNKWRVHFAPDEVGPWQWEASFRQGPFVAVSSKPISGVSAGFMDDETGTLTILDTNKTWPDFRQRGRLNYVNEPYLRFEETGDYFIKAGPDAPENLLAYADFDGTFHDDGKKDSLVKTWGPHIKDWSKGDPTWKNDKGKGLIGALNYLASKGMNSVSFLTLNIMGDDQNVFPYVDYTTYDRFDVSKLDQWEVVFEHAQQRGLFLHFKTQEVENQGLLDGGGLGLQRQLYYRELIARFGHHLALNWNMGEENGEWYPKHQTVPQSTIQRLAMARYFHDNDPYQHHIVIHNGNFFEDLTGVDSYYTGVSLQTHRADFGAVHPQVKKIRSWPVANGRPLAVAVDEPGDAQHSLVPDSEDPEHNLARMNGLWGALTAGAWGTEWYFGYQHEHSDLTAQDWRTRDLFWDQARHAVKFFALADVALSRAVSRDEVVSNASALAEVGEFYIIYAKDASKALTLRLLPGKADYSVQWFDPRNGGELQTGSITELRVDKEVTTYWGDMATVDLGKPPRDTENDWVILVKRQ
ncbi:DUF5060 domain-containing protein [Marinimicrobium sp. C2-29]|uniref:DUF5060 domain-containing protein n=1 Tax=Marinimicrobium sp. C2-29 TaxID=3139825 RepID=UPI003139E10B